MQLTLRIGQQQRFVEDKEKLRKEREEILEQISIRKATIQKTEASTAGFEGEENSCVYLLGASAVALVVSELEKIEERWVTIEYDLSVIDEHLASEQKNIESLEQELSELEERIVAENELGTGLVVSLSLNERLIRLRKKDLKKAYQLIMTRALCLLEKEKMARIAAVNKKRDEPRKTIEDHLSLAEKEQRDYLARKTNLIQRLNELRLRKIHLKDVALKIQASIETAVVINSEQTDCLRVLGLASTESVYSEIAEIVREEPEVRRELELVEECLIEYAKRLELYSSQEYEMTFSSQLIRQAEIPEEPPAVVGNLHRGLFMEIDLGDAPIQRPRFPFSLFRGDASSLDGGV